MPDRILVHILYIIFYVPFHIFIFFFFVLFWSAIFFPSCASVHKIYDLISPDHIIFILAYCSVHREFRYTPNCTWPEILKWHIQFESAMWEIDRMCANTNLHLVSCYAFQPKGRAYSIFSFIYLLFIFFLLLTFFWSLFVYEAENNRSKTYIHYS